MRKNRKKIKVWGKNKVSSQRSKPVFDGNREDYLDEGNLKPGHNE
jgi:hypothetical protein